MPIAPLRGRLLPPAMRLFLRILLLFFLLSGGAKALARGTTFVARQEAPPLDGSPPPLERSPWEARFAELVHFRHIHGHCRVPKRYDPNRRLSNWVSKQRQEYRTWVSSSSNHHHNGSQTAASSMSPARRAALEGIGFCWNTKTCRTDAAASFEAPRDATEAWQERYTSLVEFMRAHQYTTVVELPRESFYDYWIKQQRKKYASLGDDQRRLLSTMDPHWNLNRYEVLWDQRYRELVAYARAHGDCCVPISYENKQLAHWVSNQRRLYSEQQKGIRNSLDEGRKQRLEEINFAWNRWEFEFERKAVAEGSFAPQSKHP